jgi:hypothetical protein
VKGGAAVWLVRTGEAGAEAEADPEVGRAEEQSTTGGAAGVGVRVALTGFLRSRDHLCNKN